MPAFIVVGLGYGDEGKGLVTDHLVREHNAIGVVRYNGGAQAAHNVVLPDGRHHTFSQFSAGTFAGARSYMSEYTLVNPTYMMVEATELATKVSWAPFSRMAVHGEALITTPLHMAANRIRESLRGKGRHGTCGMGIGETVQMAKKGYTLRAMDLHDSQKTREILYAIQDAYRRELQNDMIKAGLIGSKDAEDLLSFRTIQDTLYAYRVFAKVCPMFEGWDLDPNDTYIFEGAQGVLLDQYNGFHPHTTWSDTRAVNALNIAPEATVIGVMRSYMTRHGAGPLMSEDSSLLSRFPEEHNVSTGIQGAWRTGWTDLGALEYALEVQNVDELAVTHLDHVKGDWKVYPAGNTYMVPPRPNMPRKDWEFERAFQLRRFRQALDFDLMEFENFGPADLMALIEAHTDLDVTICSHGPTYRDVFSGTRT